MRYNQTQAVKNTIRELIRMKKLTCSILSGSVLLSLVVAANAATVTVTVKDDGVSNIGATGTFYWAITNCNPGDTIAFNIPGPGPHFLQVPANGFPLIYQKHRITIDGYTQPGASANSNPITAANNANIKIVIDGRNGHARSMNYPGFDGTLATSDPPINNTSMSAERGGFGAGETALLGIYRSTNVTVKGVAFLADNFAGLLGGGNYVYGIAFAHDYGLNGSVLDRLAYDAGSDRNGHVAGCWFGVNPTNKTVAGVVNTVYTIVFPRHRDINDSSRPEIPSVGLTIGVAPGSLNPRSEFNVIVGGGINVAGEAIRTRLSGNFIDVLPDGVTPYDLSVSQAAVYGNFGQPARVEIGRYSDTGATAQPMVFGTDGDGVNDADEGNLFGPIGGSVGTATSISQSPTVIHAYEGGDKTYLIAGNTWGIGVDGTRWTNNAFFLSGLYLDNSGNGNTKLIIGSDFASSRSAATIAAQANHFYNNWPLSIFGSPPSTLSGVVPFISIEHPKPVSSEVTSSNAWLSLRGNVMVGNGLAPINYADGTSDLLPALANFFSSYLDTTAPIVPVLDGANSVYPNLAGSFAPGIAPYTNVTIDVYQLDPEGWADGQAFALAELSGNGFPQGRKYIGSFPVANTGSFNITLPGQADVGNGQVTVTANYSQDPAGTALGRTATSDFAMPIYLYPGGAESVGLTHVVRDVPCWYDTVANTMTNGPVNLARLPVDSTSGTYSVLGNWEPFISSLGDSTFLIEFNTFANDGSWANIATANQNNAVAKQPAAGGPAKVDYAYYADNGTPFKGQLNLSRQNGNPGRVAGDPRYGANKFITECETSLGQLLPFQTVSRWGNNDIYTGTDRYPAEQIFTLDPVTLAQTPVTNAWDYVYGPFVGSVVNTGNKPQLGRTGGRPNFLDNGDIVVMIDDKTSILDPAGEVTTFAIIHPNGTIVKGPALAKAQDIFDNMCAVRGGFVIRVHNSLLFYNNSGSLTFSNDVNVSSSMNFGGSSDANGRGDAVRIGGDIRSYYVFVAGGVGNGTFPGAGEVGVAAWDTHTGQFVGSAIVSDGDPALEGRDRTTVAVDALNRVCVAYGYSPNSTAGGTIGYQVAARVAQFDGANFNWFSHSFYPFVNHDESSTNVLGFLTENPYVTMNTRQICIAAKGTINSTNSVTAGPNTPNETTVYTVISHPAPVAAPRPTLSITKLDSSHVTLSWNADDGLFTVQTKSPLTSGTWANATTGNIAPPVTLPIGAGPLFIRLVR
jgi:hypothetical protein